MRDLAFRGVGIDRGVDRDARAVRRGERAAVAGLAAGIGVEHRAVEHDAALLGDGDHARLALLQIGVVAEQAVGRHESFPWRMILSENRFPFFGIMRSHVFSNGMEIADLRSSHSGTGRFFERRKAGLNSLD